MISIAMWQFLLAIFGAILAGAGLVWQRGKIEAKHDILIEQLLKRAEENSGVVRKQQVDIVKLVSKLTNIEDDVKELKGLVIAMQGVVSSG